MSFRHISVEITHSDGSGVLLREVEIHPADQGNYRLDYQWMEVAGPIWDRIQAAPPEEKAAALESLGKPGSVVLRVGPR